MSKHAATTTNRAWAPDTTESKTVTFGDASTVKGGPFWMSFSVVMVALLWLCSSFFGWVNPQFWPSPATLWNAFVEIVQEGYRNVTLMQHLRASLFRIFAGFAIGSTVGIALGFAMGLSKVFRGLFAPLVGFLRFIPALLFIPLVTLWMELSEASKVLLLSLAVVWIMTIAARSGVLSVKLSKVHTAYSLGASKTQLLRYVILPSALPEILSGMRVALRFSWETLIIVELLSAGEGIGAMIWIASKFFNIEIIIIGIIMIGLIGVTIDITMRILQARFVPWHGRS